MAFRYGIYDTNELILSRFLTVLATILLIFACLVLVACRRLMRRRVVRSEAAQPVQDISHFDRMMPAKYTRKEDS